MSNVDRDTGVLDAFVQVRKVLSLLAAHRLKRLGLGPAQAGLMLKLQDLESASLSELSKAALSDPAATTRAVSSLVRKGYVRQKEHPGDRRCWRVSLTPKGQGLAGEIGKEYRELARKFCSPLDSKEREGLVPMLERIRASIEGELAHD